MFWKMIALTYSPFHFPAFNLFCNLYLKNNKDESLYI